VFGALREASRGEANLRVLHAIGTAAQATIAAAVDIFSILRYSSHARARSRKLMASQLERASVACGASLPKVRQAFKLGGQSAASESRLFEGEPGGASDAPVSRQPIFADDEDADGNMAGITTALLSAQDAEEEGLLDGGDAAANDASGADAQAEAEAVAAAAEAAAAAAAAATGGLVHYHRPGDWVSVEGPRAGMSLFATERDIRLCAVTEFEQRRAQDFISLSGDVPGVPATGLLITVGTCRIYRMDLQRLQRAVFVNDSVLDAALSLLHVEASCIEAAQHAAASAQSAAEPLIAEPATAEPTAQPAFVLVDAVLWGKLFGNDTAAAPAPNLGERDRTFWRWPRKLWARSAVFFLCAINMRGVHWVLLSINLRRRTFEIYNSCSGYDADYARIFLRARAFMEML